MLLRSMSILILPVVAAFAASPPAYAQAGEPAERFCATLTEGQSDFVVDTNLHVLEQTQKAGPFRFEQRPGPPVRAIMCRRASALPLLNDWKVVEAGYPLFIQTMRSITVLSKTGDGYRLRLHKGQMTDAERSGVDERLKQLELAARSAGAGSAR